MEIQKATLFKRFSAWLFDCVMVIVIAVVSALLVAWVSDFDSHVETYSNALESVQKKYGVDLNSIENEQQYRSLPQETRQRFDQAMEELYADEQAMRAYSTSASLVVTMVSIGFLAGFAVIEFIFPLVFRNGMTPGKKIFQIAVMHTNCVKISTAGLFCRCFLGKYAIETMVPILIMGLILLNRTGITGTVVIALLGLLQLILLFATRTRSFIHDILSSTVVVDYASQRIFNDAEELVRFKNEMHEREVSRAEY